MMGEAYWKRVERDRRERFMLERDVHLGKKGADGANVWLKMEMKCREKLPKWLEDALGQAEESAEPFQMAVALFHEKRRYWRDDLIVMRAGTFYDYWGGENQKAHNLMAKELARLEANQAEGTEG